MGWYKQRNREGEEISGSPEWHIRVEKRPARGSIATDNPAFSFTFSVRPETPEKPRTWINNVWTVTEPWKGTGGHGQPRAGSSPPTSQVLQHLASPVSEAQEFFKIDLSSFSNFPPSARLTCSTQTSVIPLAATKLGRLFATGAVSSFCVTEQAGRSQERSEECSSGGKAATGSLWHQEPSFCLHTFWRKAMATFCLLMKNVMPWVMSLTSQSCSLSGGSSQLPPSLFHPFFVIANSGLLGTKEWKVNNTEHLLCARHNALHAA